MAHAVRRLVLPNGLALPSLLLCALAAWIAQQSGALTVLQPTSATVGPQVVHIEPRPFTYRASGEYLRQGAPTDGPLVIVAVPAALDIMKYEVSAADYATCVRDGACHEAEPRRKVEGNVPATGVSFDDAEDYAAWLSRATGQTWRLPTIEEWSFAAGEQAVDHALLRETDAANPADRWIAFYEKEAAAGAGNASALPGELGAFGENEFGVADLTGTVWEWTSTCNRRTALDATGAIVSSLESCGVRFLEGRHRTPMSGFVRDGRSGGCSVGAPPDNLGFRLVREGNWYAPLARAIRSVFGPR